MAAPSVEQDVGHSDALVDAHPELTGALGERLRQVGRIGPPIAGQPDRAEQVVGAQQRKTVRRLGGRQLLTLQAVCRGARDRAL